MPTFKHPCPHCGGFIARDVAACPYCGARDPFTPGRCASCRAPIEDPTWVSCPKCGGSLRPAATGAPAAGVAEGVPPASSSIAWSAPPAAPSQRTRHAEPEPAPVPAPGPVPAAPASEPAGDSGTDPGICRGCGAALASGARFCPACGTLAD
jgi:RNA polymerase subunit RPABC4/transcription elongation factor Spt4